VYIFYINASLLRVKIRLSSLLIRIKIKTEDLQCWRYPSCRFHNYFVRAQGIHRQSTNGLM